MSDWIHCNKCFLTFKSNVKFFITSCGHLKCQFCVSKMGPENRCLVCNSVCDLVVLSSDLKPDVMLFFQPGVEAIDKANQVCAFQLNNSLSLLKTMKTKYNAAKAEMTKTCKIIQQLKEEQQSLKMMLKAAAKPPSFSVRGAGSSSVMSANSTSSRGLHMTPMSNASSNSFMQFETPIPRRRPMSWIQPHHAARMVVHRQHPPPDVMNSLASASDLSYSGSQEHSPTPFDLPGSPNVLTHRPHPPRNPSMGSISNHRLGSGNKPR